MRNFTSCEDTEEFNLELAVEDYSGEASPFLDVIENSWPTWTKGAKHLQPFGRWIDHFGFMLLLIDTPPGPGRVSSLCGAKRSSWNLGVWQERHQN